MSDTPETPTRRRRAAVGRPAGAPEPIFEAAEPAAPAAEPVKKAAKATKAPAKKAAAKKAPAKKATKVVPEPAELTEPAELAVPAEPVESPEPAAPVKRTRARATKASFTEPSAVEPAAAAEVEPAAAQLPAAPAKRTNRRRVTSADLFLAPEVEPDSDALAEDEDPEALDAPATEAAAAEGEAGDGEESEDGTDGSDGTDGEGGERTGARRRRRRGGRGRNRNRQNQSEGDSGDADGDTEPDGDTGETPAGDAGGGGTARTRKRRRAGESVSGESGDGVVVRVREPRAEQVRGVQGSTRLEAKRQRRKDNRDAPRRRQPLLSEAEFLARRESVERVMLVRQEGEKTQIAVLENGILAEHYVTRASTTSYAGNVYLGKVQNVLPSMEAAFVDIGKGRNAVLYAGEVNYDLSGLEGKPQRIEQALSSGQDIMVQVTKDPIGHKGARLTSQVSLPGRFLVYVPGGSTHGISRKLPDTERSRLKGILKRVVPDDAGVIVRTAAEGASEEDLDRDVARLAQQWEDIQAKAKKAKAPALLHSEPDLVVRVIRDLFNEDVKQLIVQGSSEADTIEEYIHGVAPDLATRVTRWNATDNGDIFDAHRVDEQLQKALSTKVHLPSGGYLIIERTEAMTVVDVNTGKFVGKGGNLEETVTRNNLEAAEEVVRQLRLRDIGGIIVIDFVDMVLESNRDLVLRRLVECLGRDRTKHNVAEVTSLGLVQMTRKRVGQGLLEAFSTTCETCGGRGHVLTTDSPEASPRKKGKGIPEAMRPKATPVEDAIAAAAAESSDHAEDADEDDDSSEQALEQAAAARNVELLTKAIDSGDAEDTEDSADDDESDEDDPDEDESDDDEYGDEADEAEVSDALHEAVIDATD